MNKKMEYYGVGAVERPRIRAAKNSTYQTLTGNKLLNPSPN
ncbi:hypothetical protein VSVS12_00402 [Vibrio scophthalmi]|nr:hypothetical protein VSVS12_00402 [Vibrio scophthalmi]